MVAAGPQGVRQQRPAPVSYNLGHGAELVTLYDNNRYRTQDFQQPESQLRRVTLKDVERIRTGEVGSVFNGGQVWTAEFLGSLSNIQYSNNAPDNLYVQLNLPIRSNDGKGAASEAHFPTLNLDQLANNYSQVQPADARRPELSAEKTFANLRFVSRRRNEIPVYHYWVVPERGDMQTPNVNPTKSPTAAPQFPETQLTRQQLDARAIDEAAANRQHETLKRKFQELLSSPDRRMHPPRIWDGQQTRNMENQIDPRSQEFEDQLEYYSYELQNIPDDQNIYMWMEKEFSKGRICLLDKSINEKIQKIQAEQTLLYRALLRSEAFRQLKSNAVLKFAMAYFGLPVQPLTRTDLGEATNGENPKTGLRNADAFDKEGDDEDVDTMYGSKVVWQSEAPLEFLETYHERNLGYPMLRRKLNPYYKALPALESQKGAANLKLRGGAGRTRQKALWVYCDGYKRRYNNTYDGIVLALQTFIPSPSVKFWIDILSIEAIQKGEDVPFDDISLANVGKFTWEAANIAAFTQARDEQLVGITSQMPGSGNYVMRLRHRSKTSRYDSLLPRMKDLSGEVIRLVKAKAVGSRKLIESCLFSIPDLNRKGNVTNDETQLVFKDKLERLFLTSFSPPFGKDIRWTVGEKTGLLRTEQVNCLTPQLRKALKALKTDAGLRLAPATIEVESIGINDNEIRIIVLGGAGLYNFPRQNYTTIPKEVIDALNGKVKSEAVQALVVWPSAEVRAGPGVVWNFQKDGDSGESAALALFNASTRDVCVKPYFESFTLRDATNPEDELEADKPLTTKTVNWKPSGLSPPLDEFWDNLDELYSPLIPVSIKIKRIHDEAISNNLTRTTNEADWKRKYFDFLDSTNIYIEANFVPLPDLETTTQRKSKTGKKVTVEEVPERKNAAGQNKSTKLEDILGGASKAPSKNSIFDNLLSPSKQQMKTLSGNQKNSGETSKNTLQRVSQFNQVRNTVHDPDPAGTLTGDPRYRAWNKYAAEEQAAANLKHKSWTEPLSVALPGEAPKVQIFAPAKEAMISGGRAAPVLYHHDFFKTPTEIEDLEKELYRSRYDILQRKEMCVICDYQFAPGPLHEDEKAAHIAEHQAALQGAGRCPFCDFANYELFTTEQKRNHIETFHFQNQSFLANRPPAFDPQEVSYCHKCGSNISELSTQEKAEHAETCDGTSLQTDQTGGRNDAQNDAVIKGLRKEVSDLKKKLKTAEEAHSLTNENLSTTRQDLTTAQGNISKVQKELAKVQRELSETKKELSACQEASKIEEEGASDPDGELSRIKKDLRMTKAQLAEANKNLSNTNEELAEANENLSNTNEELDECKKANDSLRGPGSKLARAEFELKREKDRVVDLNYLLNSAKEKLEFAEIDLREFKNADPKAQDELRKCKEAHAKTQDELRKCKEAHTKIQDDLGKCREANDKIRGELRECREANLGASTRDLSTSGQVQTTESNELKQVTKLLDESRLQVEKLSEELDESRLQVEKLSKELDAARKEVSKVAAIFKELNDARGIDETKRNIAVLEKEMEARREQDLDTDLTVRAITDLSSIHPATWTCSLCDVSISPLDEDNQNSNYIKKIIAHYPTVHASDSPYQHKCHLCSHVFRERAPSPGSFDPASMEKHYSDKHPETIHMGPPKKGNNMERWFCPVCYEPLWLLGHFLRLDHLKSHGLNSERTMISLRDADAKAKARAHEESQNAATNFADNYDPAPGTKWFWQANPKFRSKKEPQPSAAMLQELALFKTNKGPWPSWYITWNSQSNDWNWTRNWRRDQGKLASVATITAKKTGESNVSKNPEGSSKKRSMQTSVVGLGKVDIEPTSRKVMKPETKRNLRRSPRVQTMGKGDGELHNFESSSSEEEDDGAKRRKLK